MRLEELVSKLAQIEEQVSLTISEYPHGLAIERQRLALAIAKQLRSHIEDQLRAGPREPLSREPDVSSPASNDNFATATN